MAQPRPLASADDGVTVNGSPQVSTSGDVEGMRVKLNQSLQGEDYSDGLVQSLHEAARNFELAIKERGSLTKISWFSAAWLGVDRNAWVKTLSYQASVYSLLQAASEISSQGDGRDRDINLIVQTRYLLRQTAPLESLIRDKLSAKQTEAYEWFFSEQVPVLVTSFVNYLEGDARFTAATAVGGKGMLLGSGNASDISFLMLALTCIAAITKLGPAKVSCPQFFSMIPETTGRLMNMLVAFIPIRQAYHSMKGIGLRREFLLHFGPRAAACRVNNDWGSEEVVFWVNLVQKQLQRAIDREKIWSRLTTSESIEVLEKDLAIFGFFIALGRSTKSFLSANGFDVIDDPIEGFVSYLIGGSVLYYPQLSSISSYQLYVEVVCEELDWLPFYPGNVGTQKQLHGHKSKRDGPPNAEAIPQVIDVCSHWMQSFIKYSKWLENPSNVKAAKFLSRGHNKLMVCMEELQILKNDIVDSNSKNSVERIGSQTYSPTEKELDSFDKVGSFLI
uniref:LETM1-like protein n=1 Tax=Fagus sylvatica TaxID=28930 RepID=A0A2N9F8I6_FAGSY